MIQEIVKRIRLYRIYSLTLFVFSISSCTQKPVDEPIKVIWKDKKAIGVSISKESLKTPSSESISRLMYIKLVSQSQPVAILGNFKEEDGHILFTPMIPFTNGLEYEVVFRDQPLGRFEIPLPDSQSTPTVTSIYPSQDTLPENLLKIYVHFSKPMRENQSEHFVALIKNEHDTIQGAFLNLTPELWNQERTILTLWLDPGRIKRDLQPNKTSRAPLENHAQYKIVISPDWQSQEGAKLSQTFTKAFTSTRRDSLSPKPDTWKIYTPKAGTTQKLKVDFGEPLDHGLLSEVFMIQKLSETSADSRTDMDGRWNSSDEEKSVSFIPSTNWKSGSYILRIETRLEDLAANNLNRPFERDLTQKQYSPKSGKFVELRFEVL